MFFVSCFLNIAFECGIFFTTPFVFKKQKKSYIKILIMIIVHFYNLLIESILGIIIFPSPNNYDHYLA